MGHYLHATDGDFAFRTFDEFPAISLRTHLGLSTAELVWQWEDGAGDPQDEHFPSQLPDPALVPDVLEIRGDVARVPRFLDPTRFAKHLVKPAVAAGRALKPKGPGRPRLTVYLAFGWNLRRDEIPAALQEVRVGRERKLDEDVLRQALREAGGPWPAIEGPLRAQWAQLEGSYTRRRDELLLYAALWIHARDSASVDLVDDRTISVLSPSGRYSRRFASYLGTPKPKLRAYLAEDVAALLAAPGAEDATKRLIAATCNANELAEPASDAMAWVASAAFHLARGDRDQARADLRWARAQAALAETPLPPGSDTLLAEAGLAP
jgi:hypothetical protein